MTSNEILNADLLDILFDNRNKQYGAYALRKSYSQRLLISVSFTALMVAGAFWLIAANSNPYFAEATKPTGGVYLTDVILPPPPAFPEVPLEPAAKKANTAPVAQRHFTDLIKIVPDHTLKQTDLPPQAELTNVAFGAQNIDGNELESAQQPAQAAPGKGALELVEPAGPPPVYDFAAVEEMAEFPGGKGAFQRFLGRHLAGIGGLEEGVAKTVKVKFVIGKDGSILDIILLQSGGSNLDEMVVKVLRKAPQWKPARQNGQAVAVVYTLPVTFVGGGD